MVLQIQVRGAEEMERLANNFQTAKDDVPNAVKKVTERGEMIAVQNAPFLMGRLVNAISSVVFPFEGWIISSTPKGMDYHPTAVKGAKQQAIPNVTPYHYLIEMGWYNEMYPSYVAKDTGAKKVGYMLKTAKMLDEMFYKQLDIKLNIIHMK